MNNPKIDKARLIVKYDGDCFNNCGYDCPFYIENSNTYRCLVLIKHENIMTEYRSFKIEMAEDYIETQEKLKFLEEL